MISTKNKNLQLGDQLLTILNDSNDIISKTLIESAKISCTWKDAFSTFPINYLDLAYSKFGKIAYIHTGNQGLFIGYYKGEKLKLDSKLCSTIPIKKKFITATIIETSDETVTFKIRKQGKYFIFLVYKSKLNYKTIKTNFLNTRTYFEEEYRTKYAIMTSPAKIVNKLFPNTFNIKEIEIFTNLFVKQDFKFELVSGEEIIKYYLHYNYTNLKGTLGSSCMRYESCQEYFKIYSTNENVSMLVAITSDGTICGRAIVWHDVYFEELEKYLFFMDRIYTNNSSHEFLFIQHAKKNNWVYKTLQNYESQELFTYNDENFREGIAIPLTNVTFNEYPYMDTLDKLLLNQNLISNCGDGILLNSTDGESSVIYSDYEDENINREDAVYSEYHSSYLLDSNCIWVESESDHFHYDCEGTIINRCPECEEYFRSSDCIFNQKLRVYYCEDCCSYVESKGEYYGNSLTCEFDGQYYLFEDLEFSDILNKEVPILLIENLENEYEKEQIQLN